MNNNQYELIGESIWNTYSDMAYLLMGEGSRGIQRLRRRGNLAGVERKRQEGKIRKLATEFEGHSAGGDVDTLGKQHDQPSVWPPPSTEHVRGHKARGVRAEDNPNIGRATSRSETKPARRAARRAVSRVSGESESKKRRVGTETMETELGRKNIPR